MKTLATTAVPATAASEMAELARSTTRDPALLLVSAKLMTTAASAISEAAVAGTASCIKPVYHLSHCSNTVSAMQSLTVYRAICELVLPARHSQVSLPLVHAKCRAVQHELADRGKHQYRISTNVHRDNHRSKRFSAWLNIKQNKPKQNEST